MDRMKTLDAILIKQDLEWKEILTGFEAKNRYSLIDVSGEKVYRAAEQSPFLARQFLQSFRPFTMHVLTLDGAPIIKMIRPFRFLFHEISVFDATGKPLGTIKQEFSILSRKYAVLDPLGMKVFDIFGPILHPWTFRILRAEQEVGKISKKWTGAVKEVFTDADNFNITFPPGVDTDRKCLLLGALFLFDVLYFEETRH
jgi:uncharacterized protein YxjI